KKVAGTLRLDLAQYRELQAFAQFGSDLDKATQARLIRGERGMEILKQDQYKPMPVEKQVVSLYTATKGYLDEYPVEDVRRFESEFLAYMDAQPLGQEVLKTIRETGDLSAETENKLKQCIEDFKKGFVPSKG